MYVLNPQNLRNKNITENNAPISDFTCRVCYNNPPVYIESVAVPHTAGRWQHKYRRVIINAVIWCKFCNCAGNQGREVEEIQSLDFSMTSWCFIYKYNQWGGQTPVGFKFWFLPFLGFPRSIHRLGFLILYPVWTVYSLIIAISWGSTLSESSFLI